MKMADMSWNSEMEYSSQICSKQHVAKPQSLLQMVWDTASTIHCSLVWQVGSLHLYCAQPHLTTFRHSLVPCMDPPKTSVLWNIQKKEAQSSCFGSLLLSRPSQQKHDFPLNLWPYMDTEGYSKCSAS